MALVATEHITRPLFRGWLHLGAALAAPFALLWLILEAASPRAYVGAAVFGASLVLLFGMSAAFHIVPWPPSRNIHPNPRCLPETRRYKR